MKKFVIRQESELDNVSKALLKDLKKKAVVAFYGELGAGKTSLIKSICRQMGSDDIVTSPSFSLINEYIDRNHHTIYHFDFYRIESIEEIYDFGYEEYFYSGDYCFIEWPERIESLLPTDHTLYVWLNCYSDGSREVYWK